MKNLVKKTMAIAAAALCLGAGLRTYAAAASGDIWSIAPCDESGNYATYTEASDPYGVGQEFYVRVRLWNHRIVSSDGMTPTYTPWVRAYLPGQAPGSEPGTEEYYEDVALDWAESRPFLGVYADGSQTPKVAELIKVSASDEYTDLIFKYVSQPGDFALPIRLATANGAAVAGPEGYSSQGSSFYIYSDKFTFVPAGDTATTVRWIVDTPTDDDKSPGGDDPRDTLWQNMGTDGDNSSGFGGSDTLGFYVKTIDFDPSWEVEKTETDPGVWRSIAASDIDSTLSLYAVARPETSAYVYMWAEPGSSLVVTNTPALSRVGVEVTPVSMKTGMNGTDPVYEQVNVAKIPVNATNDIFFAVYSDAQDTKNNLYLSSWPQFNYRNGAPAQRIVDYITVPVAVGAPRATTLEVSGPSSVVATSSRFECSAFKVVITPSARVAPNDIAVTVTPSAGWQKYVFFSNSSTYSNPEPPETGLYGLSSLSFTIKAGKSESETFYMYALGPTNRTALVKLTPSDNDEFTASEAAWSVSVTTQVTAAPAWEDDFEPTKGSKYPIRVSVGDAYNDAKAGAENGGYTLKVRLDANDPNTEASISNLYLVDGILYSDKDGLELPTITFTSDAQTESSFQVVSPLSRNTSDWVSFSHIVKSMDVVASIVSGASEDGSVAQDAPVTLDIAYPYIWNQTGDNLYVYLVNTTDAEVSSGMFSNPTGYDVVVCQDNENDAPTGLPITSALNPNDVTMVITPLVGMDKTFSFRVVLSKSPTWDPTQPNGETPASTFNLTVKNTKAAATAMWMYKDTASTDIEQIPSGGKFEIPILQGASRAFRVRVADSDYDKQNGMVVKWTIHMPDAPATQNEVLNVDGYGNGTRVYRFTSSPAVGTVDDVAGWFAYQFNTAVTTNFYVIAEVWDSASYPGELNENDEDKRGSVITNIVTVVASPDMAEAFEDEPGRLSGGFATTSDFYAIREKNDTPYIDFTLPSPDTSYMGQIVAKVTLRPVDPNDENCGFMELKVNSTDTVVETIGKTNIYTHEYSSVMSQWRPAVNMNTFDGGINDGDEWKTSGWVIDWEVLTTDTLTGVGKPANEYWSATTIIGEDRPIFLYNKNPAPAKSVFGFGDMDDEGVEANSDIYTNLLSETKISWGVSDVLADTTSEWEYENTVVTGIVVRVTGDNIATTNFQANTTVGLSGQYTPLWQNPQNAGTLQFIFFDKDGGRSESKVYRKAAKPTKMLKTVANWPSGGNALIPMSTSYSLAKGAGYGHIYVSGATFYGAENFYLTWDCGTTAQSVLAYAFGYAANAKDYGQLDGNRDIGLDPAGNCPQGVKIEDPDKCYQNADDVFDSFFYGWISATEPGGLEYTFSPNPQLGTNALRTASVRLPSEKGSAANSGRDVSESFEEVYIEAVFSREHNQYDQMGDINDDGIPDYYMLFPNWAGGALVTETGSGADLVALNALNDDDDYYPASSHLGISTIIPGAVGGWATRENPFVAAKEIRGYHDGLNFGMFQFSRDERVSYRGNPLAYGTDWISDLHMSELEKKSLLRRVFERRDALLKKWYTTRKDPADPADWGDLDEAWPNNEITELQLINNLISTLYYRGAAVGSGEVDFYYDSAYANTHLSNDVERVVVNDDTGTNDTFYVNAWIRKFTPRGAIDPVVSTNFVELVAYTNTAVNATNETLGITYLSPCDLYYSDRVDIANWVDRDNGSNPRYEEQQRAAKAYINFTWRKFASTGEWGWTCENRTDPTTDDTDGDGMPDGYEYYIWYAAAVGAGEEQLTGCKFVLGDVESYDSVISSSEIASIYNPNINTSWTRRDTDNDGIYDLEEFLIGTSPVHWDTDRDGLSDLYEVMYNINPLTTVVNQNGAMNLDGDCMAYWKADAGDPLGEYWVIYQATNGTYWALNQSYDSIGYASPNKEVMSMSTEMLNAKGGIWTGKKLKGFRVVPFNGGWTVQTEDTNDFANRYPIEFTEFYTNDLNQVVDNTFHFNPKFGGVTNFVSFYHHQVYNYFGFDPRTGWGRNDRGQVANRWGGYTAGLATNTVVFSALDEYRLLKYRYIVGLRDLAKDLDDLAHGRTTIQTIVTDGTTNPNTDFDGVKWGDDDIAFTRTQHGADTDGDAVPDGWELYIGVDPNRDWRIAKGLPGYDPLYHDAGRVWKQPIASYSGWSDGLSLAAEYAGTDSCGHHADCASIYANHPSQAGSVIRKWYNKFMPTSPRSSDTDGDGIADGQERGSSWSGEFVFNRFGQTITVTALHRAIYGNPSDGGNLCIRGGGFNPNSIDTDLDGLPDPWERQYAGIVCHNNDIEPSVEGDDGKAVPVFPSGLPYSSAYDDLRGAIQAHWGVYTNEDEHVYHVLMGMDPTYADAVSTVGIGFSNKDWDDDGLENWQEYMVQAMRHFRYDDPWTPLLGRDSPIFRGNDFYDGAWVGDRGFLRVSYMEPFTKDDVELLKEAGYTNFATRVMAYPDYLRRLGYFAEPPRAWDIAGVDMEMKYMLPPMTIRYHANRTEAHTAKVQRTEFVNGRSVPVWRTQSGKEIAIEPLNYDDANYQYVGDDTYYLRVISPNGSATNLVMVTPVYDEIEMPPTVYLNSEIVSQDEYVGTDPRLWDTDRDGMDDYYELFHGLNPLLGSLGNAFGSIVNDVIGKAHNGEVSAWNNAWVGWENKDYPALDPIKHPWMMGVAECDADGDGLRNYEESILANVASPNSSHTDPTPYWMTDVTVLDKTPLVSTEEQIEVVYKKAPDGSPVYDFDDDFNFVRVVDHVTTNLVTNAVFSVAGSPSYVGLYYRNEIANPVDKVYYTSYMGDTYTSSKYLRMRTSWGLSSSDYYLASFEMNEGYDTDNDWRTDSGELKSLSRKNSDPLDFNDPAHRQSVWFGGKDAPGAAISLQPSYRSMNGTDLFRQFTVEAWVRPDKPVGGQDQFIVARASRYAAWDLESWNETSGQSNAVIRLCFALGIDKDGQAFAEIQNTSEIESRVTDTSMTLEADKWVHLAATYDGARFSLYRDGELVQTADTTIQPANGVTIIVQNPQGYADFPYDMYRIVPSITILGARPTGEGAFVATSVAAATSWADVADDFFAGSVSEVRTWDGARSAAQIAECYNKSFTVDEVKFLRLENFSAWRGGARRNDNSGREVLPPELIQYYNMSTLPGATDGQYVRTEPTGFATNVLAYARNPDSGADIGSLLKIGWWNGIQTNSVVKNTAYTSAYVVPWIENMVGHLPTICGSIADSVYWSENYAGYTPASFQELDGFTFPNTMNPYNITFTFDEETHLYNKFANMYWYDDNDELVVNGRTTMTNTSHVSALFWQFLYDYRLGFEGTTDLIPVGNAYAKRGKNYWDGQGAETAWQETGADLNANDLPDWWDALYGNPATPDTMVDRNGVEMSAYEAYVRDLAAGMLPTKRTDAAYINREDFDKNGLPDWWTDIYGVKGDAAADDDNDGLSNYTEFLLSEYFDLGVAFDPMRAKSISIYDSDYFFKIGNHLYAGEIFTDHDFMEDVWEDVQGADYTSRYAWDATRDYDEDGWSNYAESRSSVFTSSIFASNIGHLIDQEEMKDMPIPTLALTLRYNGDQPLTGSSGGGATASTDIENQKNNDMADIVVQTFTRQNIVVPDATFIVRPGDSLSRYKYLGGWSARTVRGTLAPGYVRTGSDEMTLQVLTFANNQNYYWRVLHMSDVNYWSGTWYSYHRGSYKDFLYDLYRYGSSLVTLLNDPTAWEDVAYISVTQSGNSQMGHLTHNGVQIGELNFQTGEFEIYLSRFSNMYTVSDLETPINLDSAAFRIVYWSQVPTIQSNRLPLYLGEPNTGYVREGKNTIVAFIDLDGDGKYTYGEPMGTAVADVGWYQGAAEIELTDTSPIITRANLLDGFSDRSILYGTEAGDNTNLVAGTLSGGKYERVRVIRTQVNGYGIDTLGMENRVIFDKVINLDQRSFFYEGDVLENGGFDIDWDYFDTEVMRSESVVKDGLDPIAVTYRTVLGNGTILAGETNNLFSTATVRHFDAKGFRTIPVPQSPGSQASAVFGARPEFKWTMKMINASTGEEVDNNSYTAFRVQVKDDGNKVAYDSGIRRAPARDLNGVYTFVPDAYVGDDFEPSKNYRWFVSMYNSKYQTDAWSADNNNTFRMNALTNSLGKIKVCAKYFGPANVLSAGAIRIEAFKTPDFTGDPVARTVIAKGEASVKTADVAHDVNATLIGLAPGKYYVRGYIDFDSYGTKRQKDSYESWGYVCYRDTANSDIFTPATIVIDDTLGAGDVFDLYIEDVDTNGNCLPDAWEMASRGKLDDGTENIDETLGAGIEINKSLSSNLQTKETGSPAIAGLGAYVFSVLGNAGVAALILDADTESYDSYAEAAASAIGGSTTTVATNIVVNTLSMTGNGFSLSIEGKPNATSSRTLLGAAVPAKTSTIYGAKGAVENIKGVAKYTTDLATPKEQWKPLPITDANGNQILGEDGNPVCSIDIKVNADGSFETELFYVGIPDDASASGSFFFGVFPEKKSEE